jgi:uncharacterized sulfatase
LPGLPSSVLAAILVAAACGKGEPAPGPRPNVLFIVVDDLNTDLGAYGHAVVRSPHFDALAGRGVRFDRAYVQFGLCNPSRTSFLSGRLPETARVLDNSTHPRSHLGDIPFLPEYFRHHGYHTAGVGKILHSRAFANAVAWDRGYKLGGGSTAALLDDRIERLPPLLWINPVAEENRPRLLDGRIARAAIELLEEARGKERPFFVAVGFKGPHAPFEAPQEVFALYPPEAMPLPAAPPAGPADLSPRAQRVLERAPEMDEGQQRRVVSAYYASVSWMDSQLGEVLAALDRLGLAANTLVVFLSDNGFHLGDHGGLWGKATLFERSLRVPLVIAGPGVRAGGVCSRTVELLDLFPTLVELAGLPAPGGLEGRSLQPLLADPATAWERPARSVFGAGGEILGRGRRSGRVRDTDWGRNGRAELFDHAVDPGEEVNQAGNPEYAEERARLRSRLRRRR